MNYLNVSTFLRRKLGPINFWDDYIISISLHFCFTFALHFAFDAMK